MHVCSDLSSIAEKPTFSLREGPHEDLSPYCYFGHEIERDSDDPELSDLNRRLSEALLVMIEGPSSKERINALKSVLSIKPDCGLAYLILGREGAHTEEQALKYFELAVKLLRVDPYLEKPAGHSSGPVDLLRDRLIQDAPYELCFMAYTTAVSDLARLVWSRQDRDRALKLVLPLLAVDSEYLDEQLIYLITSWLVQTNQDDQARSILDRVPDSRSMWCYLNALLLYRKLGDSPVSRAALEYAVSKKVSTVGSLLAAKSDMDSLFVVDTRCAWHASQGSESWLMIVSGNILKSFGFGEQQHDKERLRRWTTDFDLATKFLDRGDFKQGQKLMRTALRTAERLPLETRQYALTLDELITIAKDTGAPKDELRQATENRLELFERQEVLSNAAIDAVFHLACCLVSLSLKELAVVWLKRIETALQGLIDVGDPYVSLIDLREVRDKLGICLGSLGKFEEAAKVLECSMEHAEEYLGKNHPALIPTLDYLFRCLHHLGRHQEEHQLLSRLEGIGWNRLIDDRHISHGPDCSWYVPNDCLIAGIPDWQESNITIFSAPELTQSAF